MRKILLLFAMLCIANSTLSGQQTKKRRSLYGYIVVLDPGHGGKDPGSSRAHGNTRITENEYTYDVSLRVARLIRKNQGLVLLTIRDKVPERNSPANIIFPNNGSAIFAIDGTRVRAGKAGLRKRVQYGNLVSLKYPKHRQFWISIHFDVVGQNTNTSGVRIIYGDNAVSFANALKKGFEGAKRLRDHDPIVESGDPDHGIRRLYVLSSINRIRNRVLIELGNFLNDDDAWRIRDPKVREAYAKIIISALESYRGK